MLESRTKVVQRKNKGKYKRGNKGRQREEQRNTKVTKGRRKGKERQMENKGKRRQTKADKARNQRDTKDNEGK